MSNIDDGILSLHRLIQEKGSYLFTRLSKDISEKELETCKTYLSENTTGLHYFLAKAILFEDWYNRWSDNLEKSEEKVDSEIKKSLSDMRNELHRIIHHLENSSVMDSIFESGKWESLYTVEGNNPVHSRL